MLVLTPQVVLLASSDSQLHRRSRRPAASTSARPPPFPCPQSSYAHGVGTAHGARRPQSKLVCYCRVAAWNEVKPLPQSPQSASFKVSIDVPDCKCFLSSMALVLMCGQPCSGKSEAAACLTAALRSSSADLTVRIIDESSLHLGRNDSYKGIGVAYHVGCCDMCNALTFMRWQGSFVIQKWTTVGNGIASVRRKESPPMITIYCLVSLYCKTLCFLWVLEENNCSTLDHSPLLVVCTVQSGRIASDTFFYRGRFEDLGKNVTRAVWKDEIVESSPVIAEAVSYLTKKLDSKTRDVKVLQPTIATQTVRTTEVNSLYEMDKATQEVVNAIVEAQSCGLGLAMNKISLGPNMPTISFTD
ncbi:hypothetical protein PR202_ga16162 [Eleusine coracana subsp. coracana]|uniref:Uncharacterized protein n=1 Tax=Eleusine coracana subsp. coracana TaxID=191504 RepID=A0AAV5CLQ6_ELECO|nr:hypothetical protein PR202_ga16162 [Eleusine coracana subsp. coracana]